MMSNDKTDGVNPKNSTGVLRKKVSDAGRFNT